MTFSLGIALGTYSLRREQQMYCKNPNVNYLREFFFEECFYSYLEKKHVFFFKINL